MKPQIAQNLPQPSNKQSITSGLVNRIKEERNQLTDCKKSST